MEQDVDNSYSTVCSTCLSSDRDLFSLNSLPDIHRIFKLLMYDITGERPETPDAPEIINLICWECLALMRKIHKFKWQVQSAQEHLKVLALSQTHETLDHTYMSQSLSNLMVESKNGYDKIFFDISFGAEECGGYIHVNNSYAIKNEQYETLKDSLDMENNILEVPEMVLTNTDGILSHLVVDNGLGTPETAIFSTVKCEGTMPQLTIQPLTSTNTGSVITQTDRAQNNEKPGYYTVFMSESEMLACREEAKKKVQYASSVYKCELCIIGFYNQQQVEDHFESAHSEKPGLTACRVCYIYLEEQKVHSHVHQHYLQYVCKLCAHRDASQRLMAAHVRAHLERHTPRALIHYDDSTSNKKKRKRKLNEKTKDPPKPGDLRKLLSKTTIEGYKCLECDMFFKNSRSRKTHFDRFHKEGLQCDHCKKRFVNKNTLATHLRLHEGPLPREECPICHKLVRTIQIKYHIRRHQNKTKYECIECQKLFSHLTTYQAHLKYSRAHASEQVFKYPCPMCNKGYPSKEAMQDHFNYQHLGKTAHKCPICDKPIASKSNVEKHIARVHKEKKEKPRNHICQICGKPFSDKKSLTQHEAIHSGARPLSCDICHQTFKQKASLYTHRKRVHKVFPVKKQVHYIADTPTTVG